MNNWIQFDKGFSIEPNLMRSRQRILPFRNKGKTFLLARLQHGIFRERFVVTDQMGGKALASIRTSLRESCVFVQDEEDCIGKFVIDLRGLSSPKQDLVRFTDSIGTATGKIVVERTGEPLFTILAEKPKPTRFLLLATGYGLDEGGCQGHLTVDYWLGGVSELSFIPEPLPVQAWAVDPMILICGCVVLLRRELLKTF